MTMVDPLAEVRNKLMTPLKTEVQGQTPAWRVDPTYDNTLRSIQTGIANLTSNADLQEGRARTDLQKNQQELGKSRDTTLQMLQEKLANQGTLRSSINMDETGNIQTKYQEGKTGLETGFTRSMEDLARETLGKYQGYNDQLAQAQIDRAGRQETFEKEQALAEAQAKSIANQANEFRTQLDEIRAQLTKQLTPQPTPTGQMSLPPPPPKPKPPAPINMTPAAPILPSPQQQVQKLNIDPKVLQTLLRDKGFDPGKIDGIVGKSTQLALARYKQSIGLPATADIDLGIWQGLFPSGPDAGQHTFDILGI